MEDTDHLVRGFCQRPSNVQEERPAKKPKVSKLDAKARLGAVLRFSSGSILMTMFHVVIINGMIMDDIGKTDENGILNEIQVMMMTMVEHGSIEFSALDKAEDLGRFAFLPRLSFSVVLPCFEFFCRVLIFFCRDLFPVTVTSFLVYFWDPPLVYRLRTALSTPMAAREKTREKSRTPTENRGRQKPKEESKEPKPNNDGKETKIEEVEEMEVDPEAKKRLEFQSPECKEPLSRGKAPEQIAKKPRATVTFQALSDSDEESQQSKARSSKSQQSGS